MRRNNESRYREQDQSKVDERGSSARWPSDVEKGGLSHGKKEGRMGGRHAVRNREGESEGEASHLPPEFAASRQPGFLPCYVTTEQDYADADRRKEALLSA